MNGVIVLLAAKTEREGTLLEVGCGKGTFLSKLQENGFDAFGCDPTYEGADQRVFKEYFSRNHTDILGKIDFFVLRHTLEHIQEPLKFLHEIGKANNYEGRIYIEVPDFSWFERHNAFWDVFHEHCNYFTSESLSNMFYDCESGLLFEGQYLYLLADLKHLLPQPKKTPAFYKREFGANDLLEFWRQFVKDHQNIYVRGGGAKGCTFLNIVDPEKTQVEAVIDINPSKQGRFLARTGHPIHSHHLLAGVSEGQILVMNDNYIEEIRRDFKHTALEFHSLLNAATV